VLAGVSCVSSVAIIHGAQTESSAHLVHALYMAKKLTGMQLKFVREYVKDYNAGEAAVRAGYSPHSSRQKGYHLLRENPLIIKELERLQGRAEDRALITVEQVVRDLIEIKNTCMADGQAANATRALELLGKHLAMWTENHSLYTDGELNIKLKWDNGNGND